MKVLGFFHHFQHEVLDYNNSSYFTLSQGTIELLLNIWLQDSPTTRVVCVTGAAGAICAKIQYDADKVLLL